MASSSKGSSSKGLITPSDLAGLEGDNLIIFVVDPENPTKNFFTVLDKIVVACTGKKTTQAPQNIYEIPVTTTSNTVTTSKDVYVIEMQGEYIGIKFNNDRLMGVKNSNYLTALQGKEKWHELGKHDGTSKKLIEGSDLLGFDGTYAEFSSSGLQSGEMKFGFEALMWALINLFREETKSKSDFFTVCVNLFEPPRYPILGREISEFPFRHIFLSPSLAALLNLWKKVSKHVIECQSDKNKKFVMKIDEITVQVYLDDGGLRYETFTQITNENVHKLLGMVKCGTDG
ncbi:uncharacterized protein LOC141597405 [Silene latifolia]|uniref:uncharacterized protein LOC141597405 n=1 Tax=Silene latifolia TaxID=37657 RepID=UPI003D7716E5